MSIPKVSVGIISYNHSKYLPATIESVLTQSYKDLEIVIVDDGSTDGSWDIIKSYAAKYQNIKAFIHPGHINKGISATCNLAIEKSQGKYISILGSDDIYYPYTVKEQVECLEKNSNVGAVYGLAQHIDENGEFLAKMSGQNIGAKYISTERLISKNRITAPTVMVRRDCYNKVGLYNLNLIYSDYEMWLKISLFSEWELAYINKPLALYRRHSTNIA